MAIRDKKPVVMKSDRGVPGGVATLGKDGNAIFGQALEGSRRDKQMTLSVLLDDGTPGLWQWEAV